MANNGILIVYCNVIVNKNITDHGCLQKYNRVLEDNKSEGSAEIEGENENDENEEAEKILIIDPDSDVRFYYSFTTNFINNNLKFYDDIILIYI